MGGVWRCRSPLNVCKEISKRPQWSISDIQYKEKLRLVRVFCIWDSLGKGASSIAVQLCDRFITWDSKHNQYLELRLDFHMSSPSKKKKETRKEQSSYKMVPHLQMFSERQNQRWLRWTPSPSSSQSCCRQRLNQWLGTSPQRLNTWFSRGIHR